tara:strand:- start:5195 stop:5377 length:183 start_codon:yes stop_codon:yes gene_type:complete
MDIFETIERLKYISSKLDIDKLLNNSKQQINYIKEIKKRVKLLDIERIDMSTMDKWEFHD